MHSLRSVQVPKHNSTKTKWAYLFSMVERLNPSATASSTPTAYVRRKYKNKKPSEHRLGSFFGLILHLVSTLLGYIDKNQECHSVPTIEIPNSSMVQSAATTSSLQQELGLLGSRRGEMLMRLPLGLYSFRMSWGLASAAERNKSRKKCETNAT